MKLSATEIRDIIDATDRDDRMIVGLVLRCINDAIDGEPEAITRLKEAMKLLVREVSYDKS